MPPASRRQRSEAKHNLAIALGVFAAVAALAVGGLWLVGKTTATGPFACAGFEFDRSEWRSAGAKRKRDDARLITRCDYLVGKTRKRVRADLGDPEGGPNADRRWRFFLGRSNDYLRIGDSGHLIVRFNRASRVARAELPD
ncbi:MAG TPA: hypothetical protein VK919_04190 [Solirubrobacterales bacterium]|nr:hypothetical protein [Solirubrobacterales bacterium]